MPIAIDKLVRSQRKTIALVVERDGRLTVRAPQRMAEWRIRAFVDSHADWIAKNQAKVRATPLPPPKQFIEGEKFFYLGKTYPLHVISPQRPALQFDGQAFRLAQSAQSAQPKAEQTFIRWYKRQALEIISERARTLAAQYGFTYKKIRISSARTRWGSCSTSGTLSFTYRLVMAPPEVVDYVIIHELVHTQVHNHSRAFWAQVEAILPGYKKHVRWLKKNGRFLM